MELTELILKELLKYYQSVRILSLNRVGDIVRVHIAYNRVDYRQCTFKIIKYKGFLCKEKIKLQIIEIK